MNNLLVDCILRPWSQPGLMFVSHFVEVELLTVLESEKFKDFSIIRC